MLVYIWPLALIVFANVFYQICAKSVPAEVNPFASVIVTYMVGAVLALILYFVTDRNANLLQEFGKLNWAPFVLGFAIVGLEAGSIYAYKAGWPVSAMQIVQAAILAVFLIFVGFFLYKEAITWNKILGILVCLAGLGLINWK